MTSLFSTGTGSEGIGWGTFMKTSFANHLVHNDRDMDGSEDGRGLRGLEEEGGRRKERRRDLGPRRGSGGDGRRVMGKAGKQ